MKHNAVVGLLILPLVAQDIRRPSGDPPVFRDDAKFIVVDVQVLANDRPVGDGTIRRIRPSILHRDPLANASPVVGLTKENFQVFDDGEPQEITSLDFDEAPLDIMLLVDCSSSTDQVASEMEDQSAEAMHHLKKHDRIGLAVFASSAYLAVPITADRDQLEAGIFHLKSWRFPPEVPTELNGTTLHVAEYLRKNARRGASRAIIVLTDNNGTRAVSDHKVRDGLWEADAMLNTIFFPGGPDHYSDRADLRIFVRSTGGDVLTADNSNLRLGEMFDRLRKRYLLLYRAPQSKPGEVHSIRVKVVPEGKGIVVRARSGYRAGEPGSDNRLNPKGKN